MARPRAYTLRRQAVSLRRLLANLDPERGKDSTGPRAGRDDYPLRRHLLVWGSDTPAGAAGRDRCHLDTFTKLDTLLAECEGEPYVSDSGRTYRSAEARNEPFTPSPTAGSSSCASDTVRRRTSPA